MEIIIHHTISDLYKSLNLPIDQDIDFTVLSLPELHPQLPYTSPKFQANYFSFLFTKEGSGFYTLDNNTFPFNSQTIYFTNPGHIKSYEIKDIKDAYIITFTENFLRESVHPDIFNEFPFLLAEIVPPKEMARGDFEEFEVLYKQIDNEFHKNSKFKSKILGNLMVVLLLKIKERFWLDYDPMVEGSRSSQIVKSFKQLLEREFQQATTSTGMKTAFHVKDYAEELNLHPNYLNSVIKSKTGQTVNEWISKRTLSVAKFLLINTSYSAKEIAYKLGFSEPTHFSRFFKKHTQVSPSTFRNAEKPRVNL